MKKSSTSLSNGKKNLETKKENAKSLNEISSQEKKSNENIKPDKKSNKFDKTTQSFSPNIIKNKSKTNIEN